MSPIHLFLGDITSHLKTPLPTLLVAVAPDREDWRRHCVAFHLVLMLHTSSDIWPVNIETLVTSLGTAARRGNMVTCWCLALQSKVRGVAWYL